MRLFFKVIIFLIFSISVFAQKNNCNCCTEKYTAFDFWIGTWSVTNPKGDTVGTNVISKVQNNCVLRENWTSATGKYTGTSLNFYNNETKQWEQTWIDNQGGSLYLKGNRIGNQMILRTDEAINKERKSYYHKITWTLHEDGTVRQYWETITNGKDATVVFDGLYKKTE